MLKSTTSFCLLFLVGSTLSAIIDIFEATNGHEPRVAIKCGKVPFHIDLETGSWVSDSSGVASCDKSKDEVKRYCIKAYPKLNITNIVEANKPVKFNNWCESGKEQCDIVKKVVPYRCLVDEYEADALMVPSGCKFDHLHNQELCLTHDQWKRKAAKECKNKYSMNLKDYGILLSCGTDMFTGVEFVCCPKPHHKHHKKQHKKSHKKAHHKKMKHFDKESFSAAIRKFQKYLPMKTEGCERTTYITKQTKMEERHRNQIAAVVDEWDSAEKHYVKLKEKDSKAAEEKMKRTLEVFRTTLAALEDESKQEKGRLRAEHAACINTQIAKNKRDAMITYISAIETSPVNTEDILKAVRKFIQVCEHDRVHSLRHFEHVRNRDPRKAETLRGKLLQHLKDLNKVVNESMALLNYLPEIAEKFGMAGSVGGAILKPRLELPVDEHVHGRVDEIKESDTFKNFKKIAEQEKVAPEIDDNVASEIDNNDDDEDSNGKENKDMAEPVERPVETTRKPTTYRKTTFIPTYEPISKSENKFSRSTAKIAGDDDNDDDDDDEDDKKIPEYLAKRKSPFAFNAIMGIACGVLVIMLFVVIAMVMRRQRIVRTRVVLAENNDDREHLVQMQKNGFENPTYKFFYY